VTLKLVVFPATHLAVLDHTFPDCVHFEVGAGRKSGAPEDCPKTVIEMSQTEVVPLLVPENLQDGATFNPGTARAVQEFPVPAGPAKVAEKTVLEEVEQEAFPVQVSVANVQLVGAAGMTVGFPVAVPLVRLTVILHWEVEPSLAAVIEQVGGE
jgi:hypothetical protein